MNNLILKGTKDLKRLPQRKKMADESTHHRIFILIVVRETHTGPIRVADSVCMWCTRTRMHVFTGPCCVHRSAEARGHPQVLFLRYHYCRTLSSEY